MSLNAVFVLYKIKFPWKIGFRFVSSPGPEFHWFKPEETVNFYRSSTPEPYDRNIRFSPSIGIILLVTGLFGLLGGVFVYVNDFSSSE